MRIVAIIGAAFVAGCAHEEAPQPKTITKIIYREKIVYACRPEPEGGCNSVKERSACLAHKRCQWAEGEKVHSYCRRLPCRD